MSAAGDEVRRGARERSAISNLVAVRPALRSRLAFYVWWHRLGPEHEAWVRERIAAPSFPFFSILRSVLPTFLSIGALAAANRDLLVAPLAAVLAVSVVQLLPGARENQRIAALRWHGLLPGYRRLPRLHPLRPVEALLLVVVVTVAAIGVGAAIQGSTCGGVPASTRQALDAAVGAPDQRRPASVPPESRLEHLSKVSSGLDGIDYVAAFVRLPSGRRQGPFVWRTIAPHTLLNDSDTVDISAFANGAEDVTPSLGRNSVRPMPRAVLDAADCARA